MASTLQPWSASTEDSLNGITEREPPIIPFMYALSLEKKSGKSVRTIIVCVSLTRAYVIVSKNQSFAEDPGKFNDKFETLFFFLL